MGKPGSIRQTGADGYRVRFILDKSFTTAQEQSTRILLVTEAFGLGLDSERRFQILDKFEIDLRPSDVVYIIGDSGGGKTTLLRLLSERIEKTGIFGKPLDYNLLVIRDDEVLIEGAGESFEDALSNLCMAGLGDAYLFIRRYRELSDGQKYRYKIARMLSSDAKVWVFDEFLSTLDRDTAKAVAYCLQKLARKSKKTLLAATTHDDLLHDLNPTVIARKGFGSEVQVDYRNPIPSTEHNCSLTEDIAITEAGKEAYERLSQFHYRAGLPSTTRKVFAMQRNNRIIGAIAYGASLLASSCRTKFLGYSHSPQEVNRDFLRISRVVVHPKYRSLGLGTRLVRETLPLADSKYVETMAVMAKYNPFFERSGMTRVECESDMTQEARNALQQLGTNSRGIDQLSEDEYQGVIEKLAKISPHIALSNVYGHGSKISRHGLLKDLQDKPFTKKVLAEISTLAEEKAYFIWRNPAL